MIKFYCDICGAEMASCENENELNISLTKRGWVREYETFNFCDKCGKRLNLESIKKAIIAYGEKRKADE